MGKNDFALYETYSEKLFCQLVIDISSPIREVYFTELNKGLEVFNKVILNDSNLSQSLEIGIMAYNGTIKTLQEPSLAQNFSMPRISPSCISTINDAVNQAIDKVEARKKWYKEIGQPYLRPWIVLLSHSIISTEHDFRRLAQKIQSGIDTKRYHFLPVCFENSGFEVLQQLSGGKGHALQLRIDEIEALFRERLPRLLFDVITWDPEMPLGVEYKGLF